MPLGIVHMDPETILRANQSGQPVILYKRQLQGNLCGLYVEGTTSAMSAHLRRHGIAGPDNISTICTWGGCSKTLKKGSMIRHLLTHLGVKSAVADNVHGPEGRLFIPSSWATATHEVVSL
ncbi:uncharacterized protein HD556DRAFT_1305310 [Suillus plorans]|uniref:C2H2-type domain-containing protein n=1 Tax=Suillus plorans TaxID=116603 RepID=A0A9P7DPA4_9AGAM|nr:uncharacterized protein HD556DRAFT_1305310 [Suillus plorans]KAG1799774.1 hypothetical protein HD556DRAFT_1305310 [Suillus plorans]